ncbi:ABC transporter [Sorangium cellulosum]|uniref:ABC transporter n=1 Tax=Sorangium cellulosum TaxID=56 RepID=A0A2L0F993_SORCE|nr:AarF/UbiB family protein [Sorangium cellulosum]AUX48158.1 ABC transporter [Sorangium cellulosum]
MTLAVRLFRALFAFSVILTSYLVQLGLARLFAWRLGSGPSGGELPGWLVARRARVDQNNAGRLLRAMLKLRGVFIKLGQVLSIMGGFLPRAYGKELEQLQDQVPPHPFSDLEAALRASFGRSPAELFSSIERAPLAAASLGQVHVARLHDGRKVAVKFLYPGIRGIIAVDLRVLRLAILVYKRFVPVGRIERVHESLVDLLRRETDYLHEAACMERMAQNFEGDAGIAFPEVIHELTTRDVLTMTFMEGTKITRLDALRSAGIEPSDVALRLVQAFYKMLFADRYFHADPHPGNFLVAPRSAEEGGGFRLVVLDFGAICEARDELIDGLLDILKGIFAQDDAAVVRGFRRMGFVAPGGNDALLERTVKSYFAKLLKIRDRTPAALMRARPEQLEKLADPELERGELQVLMRSFEYPEDWFYVERACVLLFWLAAQIDPNLDTMAAGFPYLMPLMAQREADVASGRSSPGSRR